MTATPEPAEEPTPPPPSFRESLKWSAVCLVVSLAVASLAIPILRWLDL